MQSLISASQKSSTNSKMQEVAKYVPFQAVEPAFTNLGTQYPRISPYITATVPHGNSITFKLPPGSGFMCDASLSFLCTYTIAATDNINAPIGMNMIRSLEYLSNGVPIVYKTGSAIWAQFKTMSSDSYQKQSFRYAQMLKPTTELVAEAADTSFVTYCPLFDTFLSGPERQLLLNKINDLQLRVTFNTVAECGLRTGAGITAFTPYLYIQTWMPQLSVYDEMVVADWSKKLVMQTVNTYTETFTLATTTTANCTFQVSYPVFKTHIFVRSVTAESGIGLKQVSIDRITMNLAGVTFLDSFPTSRLITNAAKHGIHSDTVDTTDYEKYGDDILTIDWGILCGREQNSGIYFGQELKSTNISVTFQDVTTAANYRLYLVHEYWQNTAYDNGILMVESNN